MSQSQIDPEISDLVSQVLLANTPDQRGPLSQIVQRPWFQDPLLKTIRYLENIDYKDQQAKVQFLTGLAKIIDQFDKKIMVEKIMPLLLQSLEKDT